jgi:hypothetical protein
MAIYLAPIPNLYLCQDGAMPLERPAEARDALRRLEAAVAALGPLAYLSLNRSLRHLVKAQSQTTRADLVERVDLKLFVEAGSRAIEQLSATVRPGPPADVPFGRAGPRSKLARELALGYYRLTKKLPPTTHPDQRTSGEHHYHTLFREVFDLAGYSAWKRHAQKAAVWLRGVLRRKAFTESASARGASSLKSWSTVFGILDVLT